MSIIIYTDGSAKGNPGNGGYGIVMMSGAYRRELHQGFRLTTNNRMELLAVIIALESIKKENSITTVYSDSKYVIDSVEKKWVWLGKEKFQQKEKSRLMDSFLKNIQKTKSKFYLGKRSR